MQNNAKRNKKNNTQQPTLRVGWDDSNLHEKKKWTTSRNYVYTYYIHSNMIIIIVNIIFPIIHSLLNSVIRIPPTLWTTIQYIYCD
uniref:Uncharacterized protein n=1 Tax=Lepeophtheirus salmonis TaxID=72036 RepID=A0A0K2VJD5_LEPSM